MGVWGTVLSGRWSQDKGKLKRTSNFSPSNQRKPCPLKITRRYAKENASGIFFCFLKGPFPLVLALNQKCLLINTLSIKQLSKIKKKNKKFTFHNVCGCTWRRWCSQDYHLIHRKCVSIGGGLLSERMAMGNSIWHRKRFAVAGFNTYATVRGQWSVLETQKQGSPNAYMVGTWFYSEFSLSALCFTVKMEFYLWLCIVSPLVSFHPRRLP